MDIIISAASHRSGSTLLQRIFNIRKETLIWGEHGDLLNNYCNIYRNLKHYSIDMEQQRLNYFNNNEDPNHWIACMNPEMKFVDKAIINSLKVLFDSLYEQHRKGHDMVGFKEVRYGEDELTLFRRCYPNAKIVLLVRNPIHVRKSMKGADLEDDLADFTKKWNRHASYYLQLSKKDPNVYLIKYEDLVSKDPAVMEMICNVGKLSLAEINKVLSKKIWSTPINITNKEREIIENECGEIMKQYDYL
ncbi:sulfotransferase family protein [Metabacillus fastidiosus]|uniref:sulfotransferase family protein n=1 Tax=Metabacillus fastidiosus TaxID=1458 RepID=UPI003D29AFC1